MKLLSTLFALLLGVVNSLHSAADEPTGWLNSAVNDAQRAVEGYLAIHDDNSANGTFLHRNGRWIRIRNVGLGTEDRIRFGDKEVPLERLIEAFGNQSRVRLREGWTVRGKPLVFDQAFAGAPRQKEVLEHPRRNPVTGNIEESM